MTIFVVCGVHGVGKTTVVNKALEKLPDFKTATFAEVLLQVVSDKYGVKLGRDELRHWWPKNVEKYHEAQAETARRLAAMPGNIIVDTHASLRSPDGFHPGLPEWVSRPLKPKLIFLVEATIEEVESRREVDVSRMRKDLGGGEEIKQHQFMNRAFAASVSNVTGAAVKLIINAQDKAQEAADEIVKTIHAATTA